MSKSVCLITGIGGLIGSQCAEYFKNKFDIIAGIDNDSRAEFFGDKASVYKTIRLLDNTDRFELYDYDISNSKDVEEVFKEYRHDIKLIIHTAAQPSHDWAATNPHRDFEVNALGTLNLLEAYRKHCPEAVFIFTSTNKVYGDVPNEVFKMEEEAPYIYSKELDKRYEIIIDSWSPGERYFDGFTENTRIDQCTHSLFGVSKAYADLAVQEYGRYFGLKTGVFRGGCLTGPGHQGVEQHGFLSYLVKCIKYDKPYTIYGYRGLQVRDIIHSYDVARVFETFWRSPKRGEVYNLGGGRHSNCSVREAISIIEQRTGKKAITSYVDIPRKGDHQWYVTDMSKFKRDYPEWDYTYTLEQIIDEIIQTA